MMTEEQALRDSQESPSAMLNFLPTLERATRPNLFIIFCFASIIVGFMDQWMFSALRSRMERGVAARLGKERFEQAKLLEAKLNEVIPFAKPDSLRAMLAEKEVEKITEKEDKAIVSAAFKLRSCGAIHVIPIFAFLIAFGLISYAWELTADRFVADFEKIYEPACEDLYQEYLIECSMDASLRPRFLRLRYRARHILVVAGCFAEMTKNTLRYVVGWDAMSKLMYSRWN
jgi:hypothetical protein